MSTLVDKIVNGIRRDILDGSLALGEQLKQVELAKRYGVSPIPLREALQRLQTEGLVVYLPYRGAQVATLSKSEGVDIVTIRNALEAAAFRFAVPNVEEDQVVHLQRLANELDAPDATDPNFVMPRVLEFYAVLLGRINRPILLSMIQTNLKRSILYYAEILKHLRKDEMGLPSWNSLFKAIKARDANEAIRLLEVRTQTYLDHFMEHIEAD